LIIAKEEELVLEDGAADRSPILLPGRCGERNSRLVRERIARFLVAIAVIVEAAAMEFVRTGLRLTLTMPAVALPDSAS